MKAKLFLASLVILLCISNVSFSQDYHSEYSVGYSAGVGDGAIDRVNFQTIQGIKVTDNFTAGIGLGLDYYYDTDKFWMLMLPVTINAKAYLPTSAKIEPFASLDLGYGIGYDIDYSESVSGFTITPAVGIKAGKFIAQIGYNSQKLSESGLNMGAIQLKVGLAF